MGLEWRYERKYLIEPGTLPKLITLIRQSSLLFSEKYPGRRVNSLYFDTPGFESMYENLDGVASRQKARLRWYGNSFEPPVNLELKIKQGLLGRKQIFRVDEEVLKRGALEGGPKFDFSESDNQELAQHLNSAMKPSLYNSYTRNYYQNPEGVRITLDTDIRFDQPWNISRTPRDMAFHLGQDVLELKYPMALSAQGEQFSQMIPYRLNKFSKYVLCLSSLYPNSFA